MSPAVLKLSPDEAEAVSEALAHVWREVFDQSTKGKGAHLRRVLDELNKTTTARR